MRKKMLMINCVWLCLLLGTYALSARQLVFFYNASFITRLNPGGIDYTRDPGYSFVNGSDNGNIAGILSSYPFGSSLGVGYFFNRHLGVTVSMTNKGRIPVDLNSNYTFTWQFPGESQNTESLTWTNPGEISIRSINLNFAYAYHLWRNTIINVTGGASLFHTRGNLTTNIGYGVGGQYVYYEFVDPNLKKVTVSLVDWYGLELKQTEEKNIFGANVGLNIEQRLARGFSVFAGVCYYFAPKEASTWELSPTDVYQGNFGALERTIKGDGSNLPDISHFNSEIDISHLSIVVGVKFRIKLK